MGRTNIILDDTLIDEARKLTHVKTKSGLVHLALQELVQKARQKKILSIEGKIKWQGSLSKMRQGRTWS